MRNVNLGIDTLC